MSVTDTLEVRACGIDTWAPAWSVDSRRLDSALSEICNSYGPQGSRLAPLDLIKDHRLIWFPAVSMLSVEGHPAGEGLAPGDSLADRLIELEIEMTDLGLHMGGTKFGGCRRLDATADLTFTDRAAGLHSMAALAAMSYPRMKTEVTREVGGHAVETITLKGRGGRNTLGRMYDKGQESLAAPRGAWNRIEAQHRYPKNRRFDLTEATARMTKDNFEKRFVSLWKSTKGVKVGSPLVISQQLSQMLDRGEITIGQAERMVGYVNMVEVGCEDFYARPTKFRRRAEMREVGLVADPLTLAEGEPIEVSEILEAALEAPGWGVG